MSVPVYRVRLFPVCVTISACTIPGLSPLPFCVPLSVSSLYFSFCTVPLLTSPRLCTSLISVPRCTFVRSIGSESDRSGRSVCAVPLGEEPSPAPGGECSVTVTAGGGEGFAVRAPRHQWRGSCPVSGAPPPPAAAVWGWELVSAGRLVSAAHTPDGYQLWMMEVSAPETPAEGAVSVTLRYVPEEYQF